MSYPQWEVVLCNFRFFGAHGNFVSDFDEGGVFRFPLSGLGRSPLSIFEWSGDPSVGFLTILSSTITVSSSQFKMRPGENFFKFGEGYRGSKLNISLQVNVTGRGFLELKYRINVVSLGKAYMFP